MIQQRHAQDDVALGGRVGAYDPQAPRSFRLARRIIIEIPGTPYSAVTSATVVVDAKVASRLLCVAADKEEVASLRAHKSTIVRCQRQRLQAVADNASSGC